ncbi:BTAD domain-containing putative transcriptional regulator [Actinoplanes sp. HUAS TT8]|uniref:AfsR/SARP family transcriptional regulator n=1 Tax=Actinoplanes sp. HUAS TT8 TaxID=3447453 RepID=UPI003F5277C9
MDLRLLGPVEVWVRTGPVGLGTPRQRSVLAALACDRGPAVPADVLIDRVWGDRPPDQARATLHSYLARLRKILEAAGAVRLVRRSGGYLLDGDPGLVDLHRFRTLTGRARQRGGDPDLLHQALGLWRGLPLSGLTSPWAAETRAALQREHQDVTLEWARAELNRGTAAVTVPPLAALLRADPYAEPVAAMLMRVQHALGRTADALGIYTTIAGRLADDLGVNPSRELREAHLLVLRGDRPGPATAPDRPARRRRGPALLPAGPYGFVGRKDHLTRLDRAAGRGARAPVCLLTGPPGVGKTALAVHWAHRARHRFPDGQLYVNLRGYDDGQVTTAGEALRGFLAALGVAAERIPDRLDSQAGLYRSEVAGRRMVVVLDNARDAEQVRPLLPGDDGIVTVVTSRSQLNGLVAVDGARPFPLGVLSNGEARELLTERLGAVAAGPDRDALARIIGACDRLPLALTIAAARIQVTGFPVTAVAAELADAGRLLDVLDTGDRPGQVRAVFSWSYSALTPAAARMFRLLGLHPGPDISADAAAGLAARPLPEARALLAELIRASLLTEHRPGRFAFHDLLRAYACEQAHREFSDRERTEAVGRLLAYYLHTAHAADRQLNPYRDPIVLPEPPSSPVTEHHTDQAAAFAWFTREHAGLLAAVRHAAAIGEPTTCWQLTWTLATYLDRRGHWQDLATAAQTAHDAARAHGDHRAQAHALAGLGRAYGWLGRHDDARAELGRALQAFTALGDPAGQALVHSHLAWLMDQWEKPQEAYDSVRRALHCYEAAGLRTGVADALSRLGYHQAKAGRPEGALHPSERGLALHRELGNRRGEGITLAMIGNIHQLLGDPEAGASCYERAAALLHSAGERYYEGRSLAALGDTYRDSGRDTDAHLAWQRALDILTELDHPGSDAVRLKLHAAEGSHQ